MLKLFVKFAIHCCRQKNCYVFIIPFRLSIFAFEENYFEELHLENSGSETLLEKSSVYRIEM